MEKEVRLVPIYLDPEIIDATRMLKRYGSFTKKFNTPEEMEKWKKKAKRLEGGDIFYYDLSTNQK